MDYQSNSKSRKDRDPDKKIEKVVTGEVKLHKKSIGQKAKDLFIGADPKSVVTYIVQDVLLPELRNMFVDASTKGIERMIYGETSPRRRSYGPGPRITYATPVSRSYREPSRAIGSRRAPEEPRRSRDDLVLASREEADLVLEQMYVILDSYEVVTVGDLNELVGFPSTHVDNKWGWTELGNVRIQQVREGFLIDLPAAVPI